MAWQSGTIVPASTSPAVDISKITNDLQKLRSVIGGGTDADIPDAGASKAELVGQDLIKGTTGGTSTAYTLTPAQAIAAYTAGQSFWVTFHTASGAAPTIAISGLASPPNLVKQDNTGAYVNIAANNIPANHRSRVTLLSASQALVEDMPPPVTLSSVPLPVRQTVLSGPVDSNGLPSFGGSTGSTTVTAAGTLIATAANGFASGGQVDRVGSIVNPSWTGLSTNGAMYLYLDIAANGTCTTGSTTLAPTYRWGGADVVTNNQFTFNTQEMVGKVGNGSVATQTYMVFVGEVTVAAGVVSAITWYALMGRYMGPWTATLPAAATPVSFNHNTGVSDLLTKIEIQCTTTDAGYAVGDIVTEVNGNASGVAVPLSVWRTSKSLGFVVAPNSNMLVQNKSSGANSPLTNANWKYRMIALRDW